MGLISKLFAWGSQPLTSKGTTTQWAAALVVILIVAFLWSTVVREIVA